MVALLDTPCRRCGWRQVGYHICVLDMSTKEGLKAATTVDYVPPARRKSQPSTRTSRVGPSVAVRAARDKEIVRLYSEMHYSINGICKTMNLSQKTVSKVVKAAVESDQLVFRGNTGRPSRALA